MSTLQVIWFVLVAVLLTGYAVLDGFDLGVGAWHLLARGDDERRTLMSSIGPVWDGNEVWLITGGGALFAAFPPVYATVFSGMYLALMLVLVGLIFRAVSLEFRSKLLSPAWRSAWDVAFSLGSILPALLFGVALGNVVQGMELTPGGDHAGSFFSLLDPLSLATGLAGLAMLATHGALYLVLKTEGDLNERARRWASGAWVAFAALFAGVTAWSLVAHPRLLDNFLAAPALFSLPALMAASMAAVPLAHRAKKPLAAFLASAATIVLVMSITAASIFPALVPATVPDLSLTAFNASSSRLTLTVMLVLAGIGMPLVIGYTAFVYRTFRGKTRVTPDGY